MRRHGKDVRDRQFQQKRLAHAVMDITSQVATLSRLTARMNEGGVGGDGFELYPGSPGGTDRPG
ncbi:MAG: hypothetical protein WD010_10365 [Nitriliruptor sp.]|uniref:hypothetical protein n=1 Tax=Nitriliruptor sp. TaxID=2448056 RepID=UPI00349FEA03